MNVARLFTAFTDPETRSGWMQAEPRITTATEHRSIRMTWEDGTAVDAWFTDKAPDKSSVAIKHRKLATAEDKEARKEFWHQRLTALGCRLAG